MTSAIVVGAGIAGLVSAWELVRAGCAVTVLEASGRVGGLLGAVDLDGLAVDAGAEGYSVRGGEVAALLDELDAASLIERPEPAGAWLQAASGAFPIPKRLVFGMPADPEAADVRAVVGAVPPPSPGSGSLADVVRAGYGQRVLDDLVSPLVGGVYSTRPDDVELGELAPALAAKLTAGTSLRDAVAAAAADAPAAGAVHGLRGGMHRLPQLLIKAADRAGSLEVACDEPVRTVEPAGRGWRVTTPVRTLTADLLVVAVGLEVAARLLGAPVVPPVTMIEVVSAALPPGALDGDAPRGTGVLVAPGAPGVAAKALTHSTAKWRWLREAAGGLDVVRLSYGQRGATPATSGLDEAELCDRVRSDAAVLLGRPLPALGAVARARWTILPPGTPGRSVAAEWLTGGRSATLGLVGSGFAGTGLASVVPQARADMRRLMKEQE